MLVARTGCHWHLIPRQLGASATVHDRCQPWRADGVVLRLWRASVLDDDALKGLHREWHAMDGAMTNAPLGGERLDRTRPTVARRGPGGAG